MEFHCKRNYCMKLFQLTKHLVFHFQKEDYSWLVCNSSLHIYWWYFYIHQRYAGSIILLFLGILNSDIFILFVIHPCRSIFDLRNKHSVHHSFLHLISNFILLNLFIINLTNNYFCNNSFYRCLCFLYFCYL